MRKISKKKGIKVTNEVAQDQIDHLNFNEIFVFGSNELGIHGAGAAYKAMVDFEAEIGVGFGPTGKCFSIPTKDWQLQTLDIDHVAHYVRRFIDYASKRTDLTFLVTQIGCGLAGYEPKEIAPLFEGAVGMENVHLPQSFINELEKL